MALRMQAVERGPDLAPEGRRLARDRGPTRRWKRRYASAVKVLVTGVAGFIGFHMAQRLVDQGHEVLGIDNLNQYYNVQLKLDRLRELGVVTTETASEGTGAVDAKDSSVRFQPLDVVDQERVLALSSEERFDAVCHLAAQAGVRYSLTDPWSYLTNNLHGFLSILEAARSHPVRHLVYASSSSVSGLDRSVPFGESGAADHPVSLYAASKRSNELMAHTCSHPVWHTHHRSTLLHGLWPVGPSRHGAVRVYESDVERRHV